MSDRLTFADLRARIAVRGLNSRIVIVGSYREFDELEISTVELDTWLDQAAVLASGVRIKIYARVDRGRWRLVLDRLRDPSALRFNARGRRGNRG